MLRSSVFFLLVFVTACTDPEIPDVKKGNNATQTSEWTIFIYGHADHNLTSNMISDFQEMTTATLNGNVKIILALDMNSEHPALESYFLSTHPWRQSGTVVYEISNGGFTILEKKDEENFDDPYVLKDYIVNAFSKYPSKKKGIILWNHGGSWDGGFGGDEQNGELDLSTGMPLSQIRFALSSAASELKLSSTPFDFLAFDTCLMGNIETAFEFKDVAKYYFASAEIDYGDGWDYTAAFELFRTKSSSNISQLAPDLIHAWDQHHSNYTMDDFFKTQVAIDLTKLDSLALQMRYLVATLKNESPETLMNAAKSLKNAGPGYSIANINDIMNPSTKYRDFGQYLSLLALDPEMEEVALGILKFLSEDVIKASSLGEARKDFQLGISIESRYKEDWYDSLRSRYLGLSWAPRSQWYSFLDSLFLNYHGDSAGPTIDDFTLNFSSPSQANPPMILYGTEDLDVNKSEFLIQLESYGNIIDWGILEYSIINPNTPHSFSWDGRLFRLSDGINTFFAPIGLFGDPGQDSEGRVVPLAYKIDGFVTIEDEEYDSFLIATLDDTSFKTFVICTENDEGDCQEWEVWDWEEVAEYGASFTSIASVEDGPDAGKVLPILTYTIDEAEEGFTPEISSAPAGTYFLKLRLTDVWGNSEEVAEQLDLEDPF